MLARHNLIWPTPSGWDSVQQASLSRPVTVRDAVARWRAADWPLVVRRSEPDQLPGQVPVGLPLPPDEHGEKIRIGAVIGCDAVRRHALAPTCAEVMPTLAPQWRAAFLALQMDWPDDLPPLRCHGSLAWQMITGMSYLHAASDIDLLFYPANLQQLEQGIHLLDKHGVALPLDGEIIFPGEVAVAWREWRAAMLTGGAGTVLAKRSDRVQLVSCKALVLLLSLPAHLRGAASGPTGSLSP